MARKLKTYQTSLGFFDEAIAAPSMKAALEAWGTKTNLFHQGVAKEVDDPEVIAATMHLAALAFTSALLQACTVEVQSPNFHDATTYFRQNWPKIESIALDHLANGSGDRRTLKLAALDDPNMRAA